MLLRKFLSKKNHALLAQNRDSFFLNYDGFIRRNLLVEPIRKEVSKVSNIFNAEFIIFRNIGKKNLWWQYALAGLKIVKGAIKNIKQHPG